MTRLPLVKSLLASAAVLSVAGALPAVASAHDHHRDYRDRYERVETRPTVLIREPGRHHARQPVRTRTVVVHDVRTRTVVVRQPVVIRKTVIVRQPVRTVYVREPARRVYVREPVRTVYVREPVRTVYVRPQPAVRYYSEPETRTVIYSERLDWGGYHRSRSVNHFRHSYNRDSAYDDRGWGFGNWHW